MTSKALTVAKPQDQNAVIQIVLDAVDSERYTFILQGLSGADSQRIDQILSRQSPSALDAELLLAAALMGERLRLTSFRSSQVLSAIAQQSGRLAPDRLSMLLDYLEVQIATLNQSAVMAVAGLMFATGQAHRFKRLLAMDWHWIDTLVAWLQSNPPAAPIYRNVVSVAIEWFQTTPTPAKPEERNERPETSLWLLAPSDARHARGNQQRTDLVIAARRFQRDWRNEQRAGNWSSAPSPG